MGHCPSVFRSSFTIAGPDKAAVPALATTSRYSKNQKAHDLITSPAHAVIKAANEFKDKTTAINQLWQTDFTYLKDHRLGLVLSVDRTRRLLALHRSSYVADDLIKWLKDERWHQTLKNRILLDNYYLTILAERRHIKLDTIANPSLAASAAGRFTLR